MSFKICVIGCGGMAVSGHGPAYRKYAELHPDTELAGCCDIDEKRAISFQEKFGFHRYYTDFITMLEQETPDAVCVVVSEAATARVTMKVMEMGFPLITEKPPGLNSEECRQMIAAAEKFKVANQVAFNRRYTPLVRKLKQLLSEELDPGRIHYLRYDFFRVGRTDADFSTTAIHGIDTVRFLLGSDYKEISFYYRELPEIGPATANIFMDCRMESGVFARLDFCPVAGVTIERATINAHDHSIFLHLPVWKAFDVPGRLLYLERNEVKLDVTVQEICDGEEMFEEFGFYAENKSFFDDLRAGRHPQGDIKSGLQSVEVAECIRLRKREYRGNR